MNKGSPPSTLTRAKGVLFQVPIPQKRKFGKKLPLSRSLLPLVGNLRSSTDNVGTMAAFRALSDPAALFPRNVMVDMIYSDQVQLTGGSSTGLTGTAITYNLNDIYAPGGNTNHQPRGRDQIANMYSYYRVHEVAMRVSFLSPSHTTICGHAVVQSSLDTYSFAGRSTYVLREAKNAWTQGLCKERQPTVLTKAFKIWELEGLPREEWVANGSFGAQLTSSPATVPKLHIFISDLGANASPSCYVMVDLIFKVELFGSVTQTTS